MNVKKGWIVDFGEFHPFTSLEEFNQKMTMLEDKQLIKDRECLGMKNEKIQVELPVEFLPYLNYLTGANLEEKLKIVLAIDLYITMIADFDEAIMLSGQSAAHFNELFNSLVLLLIKVLKR
jgi:hypothetical protein